MPHVIGSKRGGEARPGSTKAKAKKSVQKFPEVGKFSTKRAQFFRAKGTRHRLLGARAAAKLSLDLLRVNEDIAYPLRQPITVRVSVATRGYRAVSPQLTELLETGDPAVTRVGPVGPTREQAVRKLIAQFHALVKEHRLLPLHERTERDRRVNAILDRLVDWDKYHSNRPVKQPLWGRVLKWNHDGSVRVFWFTGPRGMDGVDATISPSDVTERLRQFRSGQWFYSTAYVLPKRIKWVEEPVEVPDPHDKAALESAWDIFPSEVMSDPKAWPLRTPEKPHGGE